MNRCDLCGLFCSWKGMDEYTNWGSSSDLEPPDPVRFCAACSRRLEREMVRRGYPDNTWMKSRAACRAAKKLGFALAGPEGAAWSDWRKKTEPLPATYVWREG